ncbi:MAG: hypothetical protein HKO66_06360, partial [Saprospiraceae bacterium]|nr:hypothetical protein [Bacteroidia bacterium]NNL91834.1 hypothetical protein [Saprospiraceae bacterium]
MKKITIKYFIALSIISIVLVQCKETNPNKDKKDSVSKSEQKGNGNRVMSDSEICENGHTISLWIPRDNGGCDAESYCEIYDSETHSVSGNLFMENDTFKNARMENAPASCVQTDESARFSILAYYQIAVP